jgi:hypothetical protein
MSLWPTRADSFLHWSPFDETSVCSLCTVRPSACLSAVQSPPRLCMSAATARTYVCLPRCTRDPNLFLSSVEPNLQDSKVFLSLPSPPQPLSTAQPIALSPPLPAPPARGKRADRQRPIALPPAAAALKSHPGRDRQTGRARQSVRCAKSSVLRRQSARLLLMLMLVAAAGTRSERSRAPAA